MTGRARRVVAVIVITILVMLSSYSVEPLMDFEERKIGRIGGSYEHKQRRGQMREEQEKATAEPTRRQEPAPASPMANNNFPGPDPSPNSNK